MTDEIFIPQFGWIAPDKDKSVQNFLHPLRSLGLSVPPPGSVKVTLNHLPQLDKTYTQPNNGCTGYSWVRSKSIRRYSINQKVVTYDGTWLYCEATATDNNPQTSCKKDTGGFIYAVGDVDRKEGVRHLDGTFDPNDKLDHYYWGNLASNVDDIRTAFSLGLPVILGTAWYQGFIDRVTTDSAGRRFIPSDVKLWGPVLGGHAYCLFAWDDDLDAGCITNTWGKQYPPTWITKKTIMDLYSDQGECCIGVEKETVTPPPPPPTTKSILVTLDLNGVKYGPKEAVK